MGRCERIAVGLIFVWACGGGGKTATTVVPTKPATAATSAPAPRACTPKPAELLAIEQARAAGDLLTAYDLARNLDRDCSSRETAWQLGETLASLWAAEDARAAYERSGDRARADAAIANLADIPSRRTAKQLNTKMRADARALREKGDVAYSRPDYVEAAKLYEASYRIDANPKTLALIGRAFEKQNQQAVATRWYARALVNAEIAEGGRITPTLATGYSDDVRALAFSPDGRLLAAGSSDHSVRVWDLDRGNDEALRVGAFVDEVTSVQFNRDGSLLAAGSRDGHARVYDVATGRERLNVDWPSPVNAVAFVPGEQLLATAGVGGTVRLWNLETGKRERLLGGRAQEILAIAFAPAKRTCACRKSGGTSCDPTKEPSLLVAGTTLGTLELWTIGADGRSSFVRSLEVDKWGVRSLAFDSTGTKLAIAGAEGTTKLLDACTWRKSETLAKHKYMTNAVAFSNDDELVIGAGADVMSRAKDAPAVHIVEFIGVRSRVQSAADTSFTDTVNALAPHPKLRGRVAAASSTGIVRTIDETRSSDTIADNAAVPWDLGVTVDGDVLIECGNDKAVTRWRPTTGERLVLGTFDTRVTQCRVGDAGKRVVGVAEKTAKVFDISSGKEVAIFTPGCYVWTAALDPTERRLVTGCGDGSIAIWDLETKQRVAGVDANSKPRHSNGINQIVFFTDGSTIASASEDKTVRFWDAKTMAPTRAPLTGFASGLSSMTITRDGKTIALGSADPDIRVFDLTQPDPAPRRLFGHHRTQKRDSSSLTVRELSFTPDGKHLVSMGWDRTMRVWDMSAAKPEGVELTRFSSAGRKIVFRRDGKRAYALARDGQLHIYDVAGPKFTLLATLFGAGPEWVAMTPAGAVDASAKGERYVNWSVGAVSFNSYVAWRRKYKPGLLATVLGR